MAPLPLPFATGIDAACVALPRPEPCLSGNMVNSPRDIFREKVPESSAKYD